MVTARELPALSAVIASLALFGPGRAACAQMPGSTLPATAPTSIARPGVAPLAATGTSADHPGERHHRSQVSCTAGQLTVHADNSSLNGILRSVSRCTGMRISGGVADQRVFGDYGPAAPATVIATLLDGTGSNMLLLETASDQPAELVLTPRTGGATPPSPYAVPDDDADAGNDAASAQPASTQPGPTQPANAQTNPGQSGGMGTGNAMQPGSAQPALAVAGGNTNQTPVPVATGGSAVTGPASIPQPINNVNGSASNTSPSASSYPTTNSVPLDSLRTPSTTPGTNGIVDSPNPPAPGSDTANLLNGGGGNAPGPATLTPAPTTSATQPGGTNSTTPVPTGAVQPGADSTSTPPNGALTPQAVYQQLQQLRQQQQQQQAPTTPPPQ